MRWAQLLRYRQTWAFALGKLMTDPIWWFYLFWLPKFLDARYGIKLAQLAAPLDRDLPARRRRLDLRRLAVRARSSSAAGR